MQTEVLIVEDDPEVRRAVRQALGEETYAFAEAGTAREGIDLAAARQPSLIVLDLGLPDGSGFRVCREVRQWSSVSIVVLSAHHSESEKVALLEIGADDYVTKPFSPHELRARIQAHLRRARMTELPGEAGVIRFGDLTIDVGARVIRRGDCSIHLTATEWELLRAFVRNAGRTLTHDRILASVWPSSVGNSAQYLRVYVARLRRKLEPDPGRPRLILTECGVGYRFAVPD